MNTQRLTIITAIVIVLAALGYYFFQRNQAAPASTVKFDGTLDLSHQPMIGGSDAKVEVAAFEDFKCPACKGFEDQIYPQLERDYIRPGKIKFYFVNFAIPLGADSNTAANAGECVYEQNEAAFWEYKTILYRSQQAENLTWATPAYLVELAKTYVPDIDAEALKTCIDEDRYATRVQEERAMGVSAGVTGTPTVFVNNQVVSNVYDYPAFKAVLDAALNQ